MVVVVVAVAGLVTGGVVADGSLAQLPLLLPLNSEVDG